MRLFWALCGLCLFHACSTGHTPVVVEQFPLEHHTRWQANTAQLAQIMAWSAEGRLSVTTAQETHPSWQFHWDQTQDQYALTLRHPWGGHWRMEGTPDSVQLHQKQKSAAPLVAGSPEALMQSLFGWQAPLSHLAYWIRGLPDPAFSYTGQADVHGTLSLLTQDGWRIYYTAYHTTLSGHRLPYRMRVISEKADLQLKIVVQKWT